MYNIGEKVQGHTITELITMVLEGGTIAKAGKLEGSLWDGFWDTFRYPFTLIQSTAVGAFLGDWMLSHAHPYAPAVPAAVTAAVIAIARVTLKPRAGTGTGQPSTSPRGDTRLLM